MGQRSAKLRRGDLVELKAPDEILETLDTEGASDRLPFMPEMLEFYGRRFRISRRALTLCFSGPGSSRGSSLSMASAVPAPPTMVVRKGA
jgi:hypothetical protein